MRIRQRVTFRLEKTPVDAAKGNDGDGDGDGANRRLRILTRRHRPVVCFSL